MKQRRKHQRGKTNAVLTGATTVTVRNTMASHPLLKKSAVHGQSKKAKRQQDRVKLRKECDWQSNLYQGVLTQRILPITFPVAPDAALA